MQNDRYVQKCFNMILHYDNFGCTNWVLNVKKKKKKKKYMKMHLDTYGKINMYKMKMFSYKGLKANERSVCTKLEKYNKIVVSYGCIVRLIIISV